MRVVRSIFFVTLFFLSFNEISCATFGKNLNIQANQLFTDAQNEIKNDAIMLNGFNFEDETISCSIGSYYPVSGFVNINGGRVYLDKDLHLDYPFVMGSCGKIYGNNYSLKFPVQGFVAGIPDSIDKGGRFSIVDELSLDSYIYCVDWSYDDKYFSQAGSTSASDELKLFYFDGSTITLTGGAEVAAFTCACRWHPSEYYVAVGASGNSGEELRIYKFESSTGTLTLTDGVEFGTYCLGVSWSSDGEYLAAATYDSNLQVYSFNSGLLTLVDTISFLEHGYPYIDCIDWKSSGDYIVVGTASTGNDLLVFSFDGSSLALDVSIDIGFVTNVSWKKDSSLIAASLFGTQQNLRIYEHSSGALDAKVLLDDKDSFYAVDWDDNGSRIVAGKAAVKNSPELNLYFFEPKNDSFSWVVGEERGSQIFSCRFSHDGDYILAGDSSRNIFVTELNQNSMLCDNAGMCFSSDAEFNTTITFNGKCYVNGEDKKLTLGPNCKLKVSSGGEVYFKGFEIIGLRDLNLICLDDDASIYFKDCKLVLDNNFEFKQGAIFFEGDNEIYGTGKFILSSSEKSTICSNSTLYFSLGITFSYAPANNSKTNFYFEDGTSVLHINKATLYSALMGMELPKGEIVVDEGCRFSSEVVTGTWGEELGQKLRDNGISLGDNNSASDLKLNIKNDSTLEVIGGSLLYKNINFSSYKVGNALSKLQLNNKSKLSLYQSLDIGSVTVEFNGNVDLAKASGKKIIGSMNVPGRISNVNL